MMEDATHKTFVGRVGLVGVTRLLAALSGIILLPILTKNLSLHDYGVWGLFATTLTLTSIIGVLALNGALYRFLPAETEEGKREALISTTFCVLIMSLVLSAVIMVARTPIANFLGNERIIPLLAFLIPFTSITTMLTSYFVAQIQMRKLSAFTLLQTYGEIGLIAYLIKYGIFGAVLSLLITRALLFVVIACLIIRRIGFKIPTFSRMKEYLAYSLPLIPTRLSAWMVQGIDRYFIGSFLGAARVGLYTPGYTLGAVVYMFAAPIETVLTPTVAKLYDEDERGEVKRYLRYSLKLFLMFGIPAAFGLTILSKPLLGILTTPEIMAESYLITPFTALSMTLLGACMMPTQILILAKRTKIIGAAWILAAVTNAGLNIYFVPTFGIIGAAITTLIAYALITGFLIYFALRSFTFKVDWIFIVKSIVASAVMSFVIWNMNPAGVFHVLMAIVAGAAIYFAILFLIRGFSREEIAFFRRLFQRSSPAANSEGKAR